MAVLAQKVAELPQIVKQEAYDCLMRNAELFAGLAQIYVHVDTGNLRDNIRVEQQGETVVVVAATPYAAPLEAKYPFMAPAWAQVEPNLRAELEAIQQRIDKHVE